jgi:hypothetical protein
MLAGVVIATFSVSIFLAAGTGIYSQLETGYGRPEVVQP